MLVNLLMRHIVNFCESHGVFKDNPKMKTIFQLMAEVSTAIHFVVPSVYVMIRSSDSVLGKIFLFLYQSYVFHLLLVISPSLFNISISLSLVHVYSYIPLSLSLSLEFCLQYIPHAIIGKLLWMKKLQFIQNILPRICRRRRLINPVNATIITTKVPVVQSSKNGIITPMASPPMVAAVAVVRRLSITMSTTIPTMNTTNLSMSTTTPITINTTDLSSSISEEDKIKANMSNSAVISEVAEVIGVQVAALASLLHIVSFSFQARDNIQDSYNLDIYDWMKYILIMFLFDQAVTVLGFAAMKLTLNIDIDIDIGMYIYIYICVCV